MSNIQSALTFALRKLWTVIAVLLVLFALLISAIRYSLPLANNYKPQIEDYVASQYGIQLKIGDISAEWRASGPEILLSDVELRQNQESYIRLDVDTMALAIDFWPTLFNAKLQSTGVALNDVHLHINIDDTPEKSTDLPIVNVLESVFLEQLENFSVTQSKVSIHRAGNMSSINLQQITWLNDADRHQATGSISLDSFANESIAFIMELKGNINSYSGIFYALGRQLDVSPWLNKLTDFDTELASSDVNFELWATIDEGEFSDLTANLVSTKLNWQATQSEVSSEFSAAARAEKIDDKWRFSIRDLQIHLEDKTYTTQWAGEWGANHPFVLQANQQFELDYWFPLLGIIDRGLAQWLKSSEIAVTLDKPSIVFSDNKFGLFVPDAIFSLPQKSVSPGIDDLHFSLNWFDDEGLITIKQDRLVLQSEQMFQRNMLLSELDLSIRLKTDNNGVEVIANNFSVSADDLQMSGSAAYNSSRNFLSVELNTAALPLNQVSDYFPRKLMGAKTIQYLSRAFTGNGNIHGATAIWHGDLDAFPFNNNEGIFNIDVDIEDADFLFAPDWPLLTELDISLNFLNKGLYMSSPNATLGDVGLSGLSAKIPHLGKSSVLTIEASGEGTGDQLTELMLSSSLKQQLGKVLANEVRVSGDLQTDLSLEIPLSNTRELVASGKVKFNNNRVNIAALNMNLTNAQGTLTFNNEKLEIEALNAEFFEQPITMNMRAEQNQTYDLDFDISGMWDVQQSLEQFQIDLTDELSGTFDYQLDLGVSIGKDDYSYVALLSSDLLSMQSGLPFPLSKAEGQKKTLELKAKGDKVASIINLAIDDEIRFDGTLPHKEKRFNRAHLSLGQTDMLPSSLGVGFSISANLESLAFNDWFSVVNAIAKGTGKESKHNILGLPERIFLTAEKLNIADHTLTDVNATTRRNADNWQIELNADQARASMVIHDQWHARGVSVDADYIKLARSDMASGSMDLETIDIDPRSLPSIDFNCEDCSYAQYDLGKIELEATPNSDGLQIEQLLISSNSANLMAQGQWYRRNDDHYTFIAGDFSSGDVGLFLQSLSLDSGIRDSGADVDFALTWKNSPFEIAGEHLNGKLNWSLTDGYLSEVSDKGSRIFTLLSLNSLVRKLSLDFRDVFAKGFFYDEMSGSVNITQGKADTRDTLIDGAAGEIEIYGYTDLGTKALNYNVSFTPNVTGNLPVLVYFFTVSPPSALAALALDQVLTSAKVISNVNYSVTGTIDEPILMETGRQSTEVELPARISNDEDAEVPVVAPTAEDILNIQNQ